MPFVSPSVIDPTSIRQTPIEHASIGHIPIRHTPMREPFGSYRIPSDTDRVRCTRQSMLAASLAGLDRQAGWAVAIAVAELVGNVAKFAEYGVLELRLIEDKRRGLEVIVDDDGPGIANIELALIDGYSEGRFIAEEPGLTPRRGLGAGLGAVRRLMDEIQIESALGRGTRVIARKWCR